MSVRLAVFASGGGSNLQSIIDYFHHDHRDTARVALVVSDRESAGALERAAAAGAETRVIPAANRPDDDVARETLAALHDAGVELVALAGYLRRVPNDVVHAFRGRMVNIHPALLPAFGGHGMYGAHVHRAVLAAGATVTGATVHHVDEEYDRGRIIAQWPVPVLPGDDAAKLAARVLAVEHRLYPAALDWLVRRMGRGGDGAAEEAVQAIALSDAHFGLVAADPPAPVAIQSIMRSGED